VAERKRGTLRLSVFSGREAKLNYAIFQVLSKKSPQTAWDIFSQFRKQKDLSNLKYWVLIRRIKNLFESDYLMKVGETKTMPGTETGLYHLSPRAELAIALDQIDLDKFINEAGVHRILSVLEAFQNLGQ